MQIDYALYDYISAFGILLIAILHTVIAVQVIVYSLRSNEIEDDLNDASPIMAYIMSLKFKSPEPNYYNTVEFVCLKRTVSALGFEFLALST